MRVERLAGAEQKSVMTWRGAVRVTDVRAQIKVAIAMAEVKPRTCVASGSRPTTTLVRVVPCTDPHEVHG